MFFLLNYLKEKQGRTMISLQKRIDTIFDYLYASSSIKNTESIAFEFSKVLHTGLYIESQLGKKPAFKDFAPYDKNSMFTNYDNVQFVRRVFGEMNKTTGIYSDESTIIFSDDDIEFICINFADLELTSKNLDIIGDSLEIFRNYSIKSLGGQFFTDPKVTKLAIDIINFNPRAGELLADICCGTGGFLLAAINKIRNTNKQKEEVFCSLVKKTIHGKEIDETVRQAANRNIQSNIGMKAEYVVSANSLVLDSSEFDKYDCLATNPPFGTKITINDFNILKNYELSKKPKSLNPVPTPPDILFLEQNIRLLKPETGRLAIVLPYQVLSGPKTSYIRKWILSNCIIQAVIDLPAETFQPHTGTKTALLIVKKRKNPIEQPQLTDNYNLFIAKPNWVGHDRRGLPVYKKNPDGSTSNEVLCDFDSVYEDWKRFLANEPLENSFCKTINIRKVYEDVSNRMNALVYVDAHETEIMDNCVPLRSLVAKIFYPGRFKRNYVEYSRDAIPFLGGSNITEHIISTKKYISKDDPHLLQLTVKEGWILITRSGTTGIVSIVPKEWDGYAISEHVIRIIPDANKENPNFLYAFLQSDFARQQLSKQVFGSVIDEISPDAVGNLRVPQIEAAKKKEICDLINKYKEQRNESLVNFNKAMNLIKTI